MPASVVTAHRRVIIDVVALVVLLLLAGPRAGPVDLLLAQEGAPSPAQTPSPVPLAVTPAAAGSATPSAGAAAGSDPLATQAQMESVFSGFFAVGLDLNHPLEVQDAHLAKDAMEMTLKNGTLYLAQPLAGEVTGAYFVGDGEVKITPPDLMERKSLRRGYGKEVFDEPFTEAVFRFDDGTEKQLLAAGKPHSSSDKDVSSTWNARNHLNYASEAPQLDFLEGRLNHQRGRDFFLVDVSTPSQKWVSFDYSDRDRIEAAIYHERASGAVGKRLYEPWCTFHKKSDYDSKGHYNLMPEADSKDPAALRNVDMTVEIPNTKTVLVDAKATAEALTDGVRLLRFSLVNNLEGSWEDKGRPVTVTSVTDAAGAALPYVHKWGQLLVLLPRALGRGETATVEVKATEDTIIELSRSSYFIYTTYPWFPQMGFLGGRYTFDWVVKVVKPMKATGSGETVREWEEGKMNCGEWRSMVPVQFPSFIFGDFKTTDGFYTRQAPASGQVPLRLYSIEGGMVSVKGKKENILFNVQQGLKNYESIFGPFPYGDLDITEMAHNLGFAQSPPGILFLSNVLEGGGGGGYVDQIIFHELAHQWWGNQVGWVSSEDDWISESWAEYSAGLMTQGIDPKKFREKLKDWKRGAMEADSKGTIASAYHSAERYKLLYYKGPYVVHMLRSWMGWDKFTKLTSTIQTKYKGKNINTDTLAREASTLMGYDMFPFFDQWVRDQGIPKIHYSWSAEKQDDGKSLVTIRARQEDAQNFKLLMVPITFGFGKGEPVVVTKPMLKPETEIQVKAPARPTSVLMDEDATQLADFFQDKN